MQRGGSFKRARSSLQNANLCAFRESRLGSPTILACGYGGQVLHSESSAPGSSRGQAARAKWAAARFESRETRRKYLGQLTQAVLVSLPLCPCFSPEPNKAYLHRHHPFSLECCPRGSLRVSTRSIALLRNKVIAPLSA